MFEWNTKGPLTRDVLDAVIVTVQSRLDLLAVIRERYGRDVEDTGDRWRTVCFLPSLVEGFSGTCAEQDASEGGGELPRNLWVSEGTTTRVWRCHSCKRRGDVIDLIEHADDLPRGAQAISLRAVRVAAQLAGAAYLMDGREPGPEDAPQDALVIKTRPTRSKPTTVSVDFMRARRINSIASEYWRTALRANAKARAELARRGVTEEQIESYQIGYAPDEWRGLYPRLPAGARAEALTLGLLRTSKRTGSVGDHQRDRLVLPYCEPARCGRPPTITGFAGRLFNASDRAPKWLNSNNVPGVWEKSSALLGLYQARTRLLVPGENRVAVTEGGFDTLAFDRVTAPSVALVSASLSLEHLAVITDPEALGADAITIAFDGDSTGRREAIVAATTALTFGLTYDTVTLIDPGDGKDPDDLPPGELVERWHSPLSLVDFGLSFGHATKARQRLALLTALPQDIAGPLRDAWGIDLEDLERHRDRALARLPPARQFAAALRRDPSLACHFAAAEVAEVFTVDTFAARMIANMPFGEQTVEAELPRVVLRSWLACQLAKAEAAARTHERSDPFAEESSTEAFRAWFAKGERLREEAVRLRKRLDALRASDYDRVS